MSLKLTPRQPVRPSPWNEAREGGVIDNDEVVLFHWVNLQTPLMFKYILIHIFPN